MNKSFRVSLVMAIAMIMGSVFTSSASASACKGKSASACKADKGCTWISSYSTKKGTKVNAHCRMKGKKGKKGLKGVKDGVERKGVKKKKRKERKETKGKKERKKYEHKAKK